jgi:hypothetical protein
VKTEKSKNMGMRTSSRAISLLACVTVSAVIIQCHSAYAQENPERFWLAGRYDWNRIVVYFDAVHFGGTVPSEAEKIPCPVQVGVFCPVKLPLSYIAQFQQSPGAEHFSVGDKYDLLLDSGSVVTVTLTTLVGFESDEGVGNDSFIGALATVDKDKESWLYFSRTTDGGTRQNPENTDFSGESLG